MSMKKLLFSLLVALLIAPVAFADFSDVATTHKNHTAINYLQAEEVIGGYPDGTFRPNSSINRAEMMKILVEGQGITPDENTYRDCFPDVSSEWFAKYVCYAKDNDWVGGYPDGTFKPAQSVSNIEAMKMILNAQSVQLADDFVPLIFDGVPSSEWYYPYVVTAEKLKLTEGFTPGTNYKRGEVAEVIFRTIVIDEVGTSSYSENAKLELLNEEATKEEVSYESASYVDYTEETRASVEGKRPFAIFFHASWCPICKAIEAELKDNLDGYPDGVMILEADYDTATELRSEFGVTRQYWFVFFDAEGEVVFSNNLFNASDVIDKFVEIL